MAFDQRTRHRLQKFVNDARTLLTEEFTRQLQATYGLDPKTGSVAEVKTLTDLDNRQRKTAHVLRETLAHYFATIHGEGETDRTKQALSRIVREQAFTVLNRLAALRMAEARGFLYPSLLSKDTGSNGRSPYKAEGFQLYKQLAGSAQGETGNAYRNYLYSLFDEFSLDLAVLFDRHSAQGRLFPRESALLELLDHINHFEIEPLWAEDETIGWIYQYFNSQEERKKMRAESQAPRNSRELAVRNQFFTPRYVVEFLTDNTLGRIWYEMAQGNTRLVDSCRYLVRRPTEVFLEPGAQAPEQSNSSEGESLSQEDMLKQPVHIPFRAIKDPRCIRMLDPACGSMHFGLYAFDLFERIYEEAWWLEAELGAHAFTREGDFQSLQTSYGNFDEFKIQIPRLIIEHNIHGVDIDPRAVQIAGLSLWQRAQRAWQRQGIKPQQRPVVNKSNIVCAEPMPGEKGLLQEFAGTLSPPVLGQLVEVIFDKMQLAGEAGSLLKIEEEIQTAISEARDQWQEQSGTHSVGDMFPTELEAATPQQKLGFDLSGIDDEAFWNEAEQLILKSLSEYADRTESNTDQKRLFAEDAAKGFAFIDICRKRFDVVLMNPPYVETQGELQAYLKKGYPDNWTNTYSSFIQRSEEFSEGMFSFVCPNGLLTAYRMINLRENLIRCNKLRYYTELGTNVFEDMGLATVAVVADVTTTNDALLLDLSMLNTTNWTLVNKEQVSDRTNYIMSAEMVRSNNLDWLADSLDPTFAQVMKGNTTFDNFRFIRCWWEVPSNAIDEGWIRWQKGGDYQPFFASTPLAINWLGGAGREIIAFGEHKQCVAQILQSKSSWGMFGLVGPDMNTDGSGFNIRLMPKKQIFSAKSTVVFPNKSDSTYFLLGLLNSMSLRGLLFQQGAGLGGNTGKIKKLPIIRMEINDEAIIVNATKTSIENIANIERENETSPYFSGLFFSFLKQLQEYKKNIGFIEEVVKKYYETNFVDVESSTDMAEKIIPQALGFSSLSKSQAVLSYVLGILFGRWNLKLNDSREFLLKLDNLIEMPQTPPAFAKCGSLIAPIKELNQNYCEQIIETLSKLNLEGNIDEFSSRYLFEALSGTRRFFDFHLKMYSRGRQAPIYWPLQSSSCSYTLWVYYHGLNEQTLYTCVNNYVEPKLETVEEDLFALRSKSSRNSQEEKVLAQLTDLVTELRDFRDELVRVAKSWAPNLNDGVQITAAPLWKLFQHKAWQKKLKETWEKLEKGDYDWAHLACSIWPERVLCKCHQDRSLALAHDVEEVFWHEVEVRVKRGKKTTGDTKLEWQPRKLSEAELESLISELVSERG